jgi:hypothetical protein
VDISTIWNILNTQAGSTLVVGFFIIVVSITAIYFQRKTTKQKSALEFLDRLSTEQSLIDSANFLKDCHLNPEMSVELIATSKKEEHKNKQVQLDVILNYFETLSIGVRIGIYDKKTVRLARKQQIIHTFERSEVYIKKIRKDLKNDKIFENLEWLFEKFKSEVEKEK